MANVRIHETTNERPVDLLEKEREHLTPLSSIAPYQIRARAERRVDAEGFVAFERSRYSVAPSYVGREVSVEAYGDRIVVRAKDLVITEHDRSSKPGSCIVKPDHLERMWQITTQNRPALGAPHWEQVWNGAVAVTDLALYEEDAA